MAAVDSAQEVDNSQATKEESASQASQVAKDAPKAKTKPSK